MAVYKQQNGKWYVSAFFKDDRNERHRTTKRGFKTKTAAMEWEREFVLKNKGNLDMKFETFCDLYVSNMKNRIKRSTWETKEVILKTKALPYFKGKRMCDIEPVDILHWQNEILGMKTDKGVQYSDTYLRTIYNQLNALFNHAVTFYGLKENPTHKVGSMGRKETRAMEFWTLGEYEKFIQRIDKTDVCYYAFEILYWCGLRFGEMLALTPSDFNFTTNTVSITKSLQRIHGEDIITEPKTEKSIRCITMPKFLAEEIKGCISNLEINNDERLFNFTKQFLRNKMKVTCQKAEIKRIRVHDLRHSHVSLLIELGFSAVAIAERLGHESTDITFRYAHLFPQTMGNIAERLDELRK